MTTAEAADRNASMTVKSSIEAVERAIAALFPAFARCAALRINDACTTPFPEELDALAGAVRSRRREFECGRACAHSALRALGADDSAILMASTRAPLWPSGIVGSISHTRTIAAAVACRSTDAAGVGLDIERSDAPLDEQVWRLMMTPAEVAQVADPIASDPRAAVLIFSAKECVYKVVAPLWGVTLNHQDVSIRIEAEHEEFVASIRAPAAAGSPAVLNGPRTLFGSFAFVDDHVVTGICVERRARGAVGPAQ